MCRLVHIERKVISTTELVLSLRIINCSFESIDNITTVSNQYMDLGPIGWHGAHALPPVEMEFAQELGNVQILSRNTAEMIAPLPDQPIRIAKLVGV